MTRPPSPARPRQFSSDPPSSTLPSAPSPAASIRHSNRRPLPARKRDKSADASELDDEPGLMPVIDTIVVAAALESAAPAPLLVDRLLSTAEATAFFGCHARTLHRWRQRRLIGAVRVGRTVLYVGADIDALIQSRLTDDVLRASGASGLGGTDCG